MEAESRLSDSFRENLKADRGILPRYSKEYAWVKSFTKIPVDLFFFLPRFICFFYDSYVPN